MPKKKNTKGIIVQKEYFNVWEFEQAFSIIHANPKEAKARFENYLIKYPKDYIAYCHYADVLIMLGKEKEAEEVLNKVSMLTKNDKIHVIDLKKKKEFEEDFIVSKIRLLSYQENYEELYDYYLNNCDKVNKINISYVPYYCMKKLNIYKQINEIRTYLLKQMLDYDEKDFYKHILKHLADFNHLTLEYSVSVFIPGFPIGKVLEEIRKYIPSDKKLFSNFFDNKYVFKYDGCGRINKKLVDYFEIVCLNNTKDIITMYPCEHGEHFNYIDLNYLQSNKENPKIKIKSQIEKFNDKYRL